MNAENSKQFKSFVISKEVSFSMKYTVSIEHTSKVVIKSEDTICVCKSVIYFSLKMKSLRIEKVKFNIISFLSINSLDVFSFLKVFLSTLTVFSIRFY